MPLTKATFLTTLTCPTLSWLTRAGLHQEPQSTLDKFNIEEGIEVHKRARSLFPQSTLITEPDPTTSTKKTAQLLKTKTTSTILEAAFLADNFTARADVLKREETGWKLLEVKSSVNLKPELIDDIAYTTMVAKKTGLNITACSLLLVSKDYRLGMPDKKLFKEVDQTEQVLKRADEFELLSKEIRETLSQDTPPTPELKLVCKNCPIFKNCCGREIDHPILELPRLHHTKFCQLNDMGIASIKNIPDEFTITVNQSVVREAVKTGQVIIKDGLKSALSKIIYPAYYLDFETTNTAIPLYADIAPYTQIPFLYSVHKCSEVGKVISHSAYMADPAIDCRRELAVNLIRDCGEKGTVFSYSHFEKQIIQGLMECCPDMKGSLEQLIERLVDLKEILAKYIYHPAFGGSYSIKKVLPVLVPDMSYEGLDIADGGEAMVQFAWLVRGKYGREEGEVVKGRLVEYCAVDTLGMVRVFEVVEGC